MYAIIDADGWFRNYATVYSTHATIEEARKAKGKTRSVRIIKGCNREEGYRISAGGLQALLSGGNWREVS